MLTFGQRSTPAARGWRHRCAAAAAAQRVLVSDSSGGDGGGGLRVLTTGPGSVLEGPVAAGLADEVLEQVVVHVGEGLRLRHRRQVVHAELEAELLQVLQKPRAPTGQWPEVSITVTKVMCSHFLFPGGLRPPSSWNRLQKD